MKQDSALLRSVGPVLIPATGAFDGADRFVVDTQAAPSIRIAWVGTTFGNLFGNTASAPAGQTTLRCHRLLRPLSDSAIIAALTSRNRAQLVSNGEALTTGFVTLERDMRTLGDAIANGEPVLDTLTTRIAELRAGQSELQQHRDRLLSDVETTIAQFHSLLEQQGRGEDGILLVNGLANMFYLRGVDGVLRSVHAMWSYDGWLLYCYSAERPHRWSDGYQVFAPAAGADLESA